MIQGEQQDRRRQRLIASLISLALLLLLLSAWCAVSGEKKQGDLSSLATSTVDVSINPTGQAGGASPTATGVGGFDRNPPLLTEVLGAQAPGPPPPEPSPTPEEPTETPTAAPGTPTETPAGSPTVVAEATGTPFETPTPGPPIINFDGLFAPGGYASGGVRVTNSGNSDFYYSIALDVEGDLAFGGALQFRIYTIQAADCNFAGQPAIGQNVGAAPGNLVYSGNFVPGKLVGDAAQENAPGDIFLAANNSMLLCMDVFFPWEAGNEYQAASVNGTFVFTAKTPE